MTRYSISQPVNAVEAPRLLKGQGRYTDDITLPHQAYAVFVRSPHPHAEIKSIDTAMAEGMPGVLAILTGEDYAADGLGPVSGQMGLKRRDGSVMNRPNRPAITRDRVRHIGQIVAMVVAESINQAKDAAEAVMVDYEPLPAHFSTADANKPGTLAIWDESPENESYYIHRGDKAAVDEALSKSKHVVSDTFVVSRVTANSMEPRAVNASYDPGRDHYTVYACQQRPYVWRTMMTKHVFQIPENKMTVIAGDVGGSFGMKGPLYTEIPLAAWAARKVGRPVKWTCERSESHIADDQARDMVVKAELGLDEDGKFTAIRFSSNNALGGYLTMNGFGSSRGMAGACCGTYVMPAIDSEAMGVFTNTVPTSNYRGPGGTPGTYVLERIIDMGARAAGIDPAEVRRRNYIPASAMPYKLPTGAAYDCGDFEAVMDDCLKRADYAGAEKRKEEARKRGKLRGVGVSSSVDPSAGPGPESAELRFDPSGTVTVLCGSTAGGQSHATIYTQIVSQTLGMDIEDIRVIEGETDKLAWGTGTGAARTATLGGNAVAKATNKVLEKTTRIAAHLLEAPLEDIEFEDGTFSAKGTNRTIDFPDVAKAAFVPGKLPPDIEVGLFETATWVSEAHNIPNSFQVVEVEIDPDTGELEIDRYTVVYDVGVELNPTLVRGQVHGGVVQATGQAILEQMVYDPETGQVLTGSFMDYAMPRAENFCRFDVASHPVPTKTNPLGCKGAGECGTVGSLAAVMNAINDALAPEGVTNFVMPATPHRVWAAIQEARAGRKVAAE